MNSLPNIVDQIQHTELRDFVKKHVLNHKTKCDQVSDDNFLKYTVYEDNSDYKKTIFVTSAAESKLSPCGNGPNHGIQKLEIYRDRFGNGHKMVFSQKVCNFVCIHSKKKTAKIIINRPPRSETEVFAVVFFSFPKEISKMLNRTIR